MDSHRGECPFSASIAHSHSQTLDMLAELEVALYLYANAVERPRDVLHRHFVLRKQLLCHADITEVRRPETVDLRTDKDV